MFYKREVKLANGTTQYTTIVIPHITALEVKSDFNRVIVHLVGKKKIELDCDSWSQTIDLSSSLEELIYEFYNKDEEPYS
ncbi:MAG: hypothetical protein ACLFR1_06645 [Spirochaetia bacterium]